MVVRWHLNVYWYTIAVMVTFLIFLMIPDSVDFSNKKSNYHKSMNNLADKNLKATSSSDRAQISRQFVKAEKHNAKSSKGFYSTSLIPLKVILVLVMLTFTVLIAQILWNRKKIQTTESSGN